MPADCRKFRAAVTHCATVSASFRHGIRIVSSTASSVGETPEAATAGRGAAELKKRGRTAPSSYCMAVSAAARTGQELGFDRGAHGARATDPAVDGLRR